MTDILTPPPYQGPAPAAGRSRPGPGRRLAAGAFVLTCLAVAVAVPAPYLTSSLEAMAEGGQGLAEHYVDQPWAIRAALLVHASSSGLAMALTPLQWSGRIRRRVPALHRWSGRLSAAAIAVGGLSGLVIAQVSYAGIVGTLGFSTLALVWMYSTFRAVATARSRRMAAHRRWSNRVIALTYAAVTLRLWVGLGIAAQVPFGVDPDVAFDRIYVLTPFLSWVPNLVAVELGGWRRRLAGRHTRNRE